MNQDFEKIKKTTISESIVNQIKKMIIVGKLTPGEKLPSERELTELFDVSRPSVREAMRSLYSIGIVDIRSGEGTYLNENTSILSDHFKLQYLLKKYSVLELVEARKILEVEIIKLAMIRGTKENFEYLQEMFIETLKQKDNPREFIKADFNFHLAIAYAAQNPYLAEMLNTTRELLLEINIDVVRKPGQIERVIESHKDILEAIIHGNIEMAQISMNSHLDMVATVMNDIFMEDYKKSVKKGGSTV